MEKIDKIDNLDFHVYYDKESCTDIVIMNANDEENRLRVRLFLYKEITMKEPESLCNLLGEILKINHIIDFLKTIINPNYILNLIKETIKYNYTINDYAKNTTVTYYEKSVGEVLEERKKSCMDKGAYKKIFINSFSALRKIKKSSDKEKQKIAKMDKQEIQELEKSNGIMTIQRKYCQKLAQIKEQLFHTSLAASIKCKYCSPEEGLPSFIYVFIKDKLSKLRNIDEEDNFIRVYINSTGRPKNGTCVMSCLICINYIQGILCSFVKKIEEDKEDTTLPELYALHQVSIILCWLNFILNISPRSKTINKKAKKLCYLTILEMSLRKLKKYARGKNQKMSN